MAKKIIRLTESDLARLVERVIMEQVIDFEKISQDLKDELVGKTSVFFSTGQQFQYKIDDVTFPSSITKPRFVNIVGTKGVKPVDGQFRADADNPSIQIEYKCSTNADEPGNVSPESIRAKLYTDRGGRNDGKITKGLAEAIEKNWCSKLPKPPSTEI